MSTPINYLRLWWQLVLVCALMVKAYDGDAQARSQPTAPKRNDATPAPSGQLAPQKMEEALRMLLRADSVSSQRQRAKLGTESSGLVVDQTITKIGHDFYDEFYSRWEAPVGNEDFTIVIGEKPSRGNNNAIVTVVVNNEELLEFPLQGKQDIIEEATQEVIDVAKGFLQQAFNLSKQLERGNKQALETY